MHSPRKSRPIQFISLLTAMILIMLLLVSCGGNAPSGGDKPDVEEKPDVTAPQDEEEDVNTQQQQDEDSDTPGAPASASESYSAYIQAKGELITKLTDALANNPGTEFTSMSLLGVSMVDLAMLPASSFGLGEAAAITALGFLGAEDIEYSESGNKYSVKYRGQDGLNYELHGEYDKAADALKCTSFVDGKESLTSEYRKTSFGYVSQIYVIDDDGSTYVYQLAVSGPDGVVGMSQVSEPPPLLTGNESIDFPKQCKEWYAIKGDEVTGVTSDGDEISFVYTPSENE